MQETQETQVRFQGWKDSLEEEMASHSIFLFGESQGQRSLTGYSLWDRKESDTTEHARTWCEAVIKSFSK